MIFRFYIIILFSPSTFPVNFYFILLKVRVNKKVLCDTLFHINRQCCAICLFNRATLPPHLVQSLNPEVLMSFCCRWSDWRVTLLFMNALLQKPPLWYPVTIDYHPEGRKRRRTGEGLFPRGQSQENSHKVQKKTHKGKRSMGENQKCSGWVRCSPRFESDHSEKGPV